MSENDSVRPCAIEPISLNLEGREVTVTSLIDVGSALTEHWPAEFSGSRKYLAARTACLNALAGVHSPRVARHKFVEAAREAGLLQVGSKVFRAVDRR